MPGLTVIHVPPLAQAKGIDAAVRRAARAALEEIGRLTQTAVRRRIRETKDSRGFVGRVDRALLVNSVVAQAPRMGPTKATQATFSRPPAAQYAHVVEGSRQPGRTPPPVAAIRQWLRRSDKGRALVDQARATLRAADRQVPPADELLDTLAVRVARSIGAKGIPGIAMFEETRQEFAAGKAAGIFRRHLDREIARSP